MSFQTGLSGLNSASRNLDVIGNNIANANTSGMKSSRTEFSAIVASSLTAVGNGGSGGIGVGVAAVTQQFSQGNVTVTGNNLDVAIDGDGFIQLQQPDGSFAYTRDGAIKLDKEGFLKTNLGANVLGFATDTLTGKTTGVTLQPLQVPTAAPISARATEVVRAEFNLDTRARAAAGVAATPGPPATPAIPSTPRATFGTSLNVYDAQGVASPVNLYFEKTATANTWEVFTGLKDIPVTGDNATAVATLTFDSSGRLTGPTIGGTGPNADKVGFVLAAPTTIASGNPNDADNFLDGPLDIVLSGATQFGSAFAVSNLSQDGYSSGELIALNIGADGVIATRYSNGQTLFNGQITLADFRNVQGLAPQAGNAWAATFASGAPVQGAPGNGKFGGLRSGALEDSNVDLTTELVNMMTAQRAYQANAQTIKTQDQVMSTLVNLR
jgi:flagellar hook protein FlgE